ncbi:methyltransferase domain-containing protein [Streptomyces sp. SID3343]|uniref:methyltransferase domain-containing protein n=1 Tax=Streptomyces sp. SID3343 TaxID=2690260 RepID=UPI0031F9FF46
MTGTGQELRPGRARLARALRDSGVIPAAWSPAFEAIDRAWFLPTVMWPFDMATATSVTCDRDTDPDTWFAYADANVPVTTQWDDGRHTGPAPGRVPTSSASMPSVVMAMLDDLDIHPGHRVLEVGTGTGWNAALLTHRLGPDHVTTVEVDPTVAATAENTLRAHGLHPTVITGDGLLGHPPAAPYDRIIATAGLRRVPYAWVEQTVPGGVIVAPWGTRLTNADHVVRLVVADDGKSASGRFTTPVEFMKIRSQRPERLDQAAYLPDGFPGDATTTVTTLTSHDVGFEDPIRHPFMTAAGVLVGDCVLLSDRRAGAVSVWLYALSDRSWAAGVFHDATPRTTVYQSGSRRLWDEIESAHRWWTHTGSPTCDRFGLTIDPQGEHAWLDVPTNRLDA